MWKNSNFLVINSLEIRYCKAPYPDSLVTEYRQYCAVRVFTDLGLIGVF